MKANSRERLQLVLEKVPSRISWDPQRRVAVLALPNSALSDLVGPYETFLMAGQLAQKSLGLTHPCYDLTLLSIAGNSISTLTGLEIAGARPFDSYRDVPDTLIVVGEPDSLNEEEDYSTLFTWLRTTASGCRRVCSVCTGAFCLARAGLLDGHRVTTHWRYASALAKRHPAVQVNPEPLFVRDGKFYTSAGCTAAMDLSLAIVEEDLGVEIATELARETIMYLRRPGRHAQISPLLRLEMSERGPMRELQVWMLEHVHLPLTVEDLAERVHMSPRNFARSFAETAGTTPARFLETLRLEAARRRIEETRGSMDQIASECGFGSSEVMRRTFIRCLGVPPSAYRRQIDIA